MVIPVVLFLLGTPEVATSPARPARTEAAPQALAEIEKAASLLNRGAKVSETVLERMTRVADADRSGDVSLGEATEMRRTAEFGVRLAPLVQKKFDRSRQEKALGATREEFDARSKTYRKLAYALNGLVEVPSIDVEAAVTGRPGPGIAP